MNIDKLIKCRKCTLIFKENAETALTLRDEIVQHCSKLCGYIGNFDERLACDDYTKSNERYKKCVFISSRD